MNTEKAEQKAKELVDKFKKWQHKSQDINYSVEQIDESVDRYAKQCAIIAVDEIINTSKWFYSENYSHTIDMDITHKYSQLIKFWDGVKEKINLL